MRKYVLIIFLAALSFSFNETFHAENTWWNAKRNSKVQIFRSGDKYYGKIIWLQSSADEKGNPKTDKENPDAALRNRPLIDLIVLRDFKQANDPNILEGGTVYDPTSGRTYCGKITFEGKKLILKGNICGLGFLSGSTVWDQVE